MAAEGAQVTIVDLNEEKAVECIALIEKDGGVATFVKANVAKRDEIARAVEASASGGALHVLVNAAQYFAMPKALELVTDKDWELSEATGPKATFRFMQLAHPFLKAAGAASVINFVRDRPLAESLTPDHIRRLRVRSERSPRWRRTNGRPTASG